MIRTTLFSFALLGAALAAVACTNGSESTSGSSDDELRASASCADKACGEPCTVCNGAPGCFETAVLKFCSADKRCKAEQPVCAPAYDPCAGKACGDTCKICPPGDPSCFETLEVKTCNAQGTCTSQPAVCGGTGAYQPCAGKACGDTCTICPPGDPDCFETQEVKVCHADGTCSGKAATCN